MERKEEYIIEKMLEKDLDFHIHLWNQDLNTTFRFYYGHDYYSPLILKKDNKLAGIGHQLLFEKTCWLGMIVVLEEHRNQGLGRKLTEALLDLGKEMGCVSQLLFATDMGEPVYRKLGFTLREMYINYKAPDKLPQIESSDVYHYHPDDFESIISIDKQITGENRLEFLKMFINNCFVFKPKETVEGFLLIDLGMGLIQAQNNQAGLALMNQKVLLGKKDFIIPESNVVARDYLKSLGYFSGIRIPSMVFGQNLFTDFSAIYSRGTGYSG